MISSRKRCTDISIVIIRFQILLIVCRLILFNGRRWSIANANRSTWRIILSWQWFNLRMVAHLNFYTRKEQNMRKIVSPWEKQMKENNDNDLRMIYSYKYFWIRTTMDQLDVCLQCVCWLDQDDIRYPHVCRCPIVERESSEHHANKRQVIVDVQW